MRLKLWRWLYLFCTAGCHNGLEGSLKLNRGGRGTLKHLASQTNMKQKGQLNRGERGTLKHLVSPDKNEIERKGKQSKGTCTCYRHVVQNRKVR